ncbi:hypothetical protein MN608_03141 [Microdochium nivale]|nr:hypothetical protein MN608_03141 [Microdochium nivale]
MLPMNLKHGSLTTIAAAAALCLAIPAMAANRLVPNTRPDVQGAVHFPTPRLDRPYPGNWDAGVEPPNSWTLQLNVSRDRMRWSPNWFTGPLDNTIISAELIPPRINSSVPAGFTDPNDEWWVADHNITRSWLVSMLVPNPAALGRSEEPNDVEGGTCPTSVFSKECVDAAKFRLRNHELVTRGVAGPKTDLGMCGGLGSYSTREITMDSSFRRTSEMVWQYKNSDRIDAYNVYGARTFPVVLIWGYTDETDQVGAALPLDHVQFLCVKADRQFREGGAAMPNGAGVRSYAAAGGSVVIWASALTATIWALL